MVLELQLLPSAAKADNLHFFYGLELVDADEVFSEPCLASSRLTCLRFYNFNPTEIIINVHCFKSSRIKGFNVLPKCIPFSCVDM